MKKLAIGIAAVAAFAASAPAYAANDTLVFDIVAEVDPFCRLWTDDSETAVQMVGDSAQLGTVRELCNMPNGYVVRAEFTNLDQGSVIAGSDIESIDATGRASFTYSEARSQTRSWQLQNARKVQPEGAVFLRLSISPL